jgi:DNA-directed RNA polymerase subunit RPC12/RpoP
VTPRERKRDPHECSACGTRFDVTYFDDRRGSRDAGSTLAEVACPTCGRARSMALPMGAEKTLLVEIDETEADEGGGG